MTRWTWGVGDIDEPHAVFTEEFPEDRSWPSKEAAIEARLYTSRDHDKYFNLLQALETVHPEAVCFMNGPILWERQLLWVLYVKYSIGLNKMIGVRPIGIYTSVEQAKRGSQGILEDGTDWKRYYSGAYGAEAVDGLADLSIQPWLPDREITWTKEDLSKGWDYAKDLVIERAKSVLDSAKSTR